MQLRLQRCLLQLKQLSLSVQQIKSQQQVDMVTHMDLVVTRTSN
jgi:hypothetical protein